MVPGLADAASGMIGGLTGIASGIIGGGKRRREQRAAEKELAINKARYENLDTSNLAANMENAYEDLTVNTQQADFAAQQQNQALANTMSGMGAAAGGSGIAALAQAMAGQQSQNMQQASASIGAQESANTKASAQAAGANQMAKAQGESERQSRQADMNANLMNMSREDAANAQGAVDQSTADIVGGGAGIIGGVAGMLSERSMKKNIKKVGESPSGLNVYNFEYKNKKHGKGKFQGVMSDEVPSYAVVSRPGKPDIVNYNLIDVVAKSIKGNKK